MIRMTVNDFFYSIIKHSKMIIFLTALSIVICAAGINVTQKSTAKVIIKYISADAKDGLTENGEQIRPYEISSSAVVQRAMEQLGYENVDTERLRRNIDISPIVPTAEEEKYNSWIESFSDYSNTEEDKEYPVYYEVSYTTAYGRDFAKNVLNAVIKQYRILYAQRHTYSSDVTDLGGEAVQQYDYYQTIELLKDKLENNIQYLNNISTNDVNYRSVKTGYSIDDLEEEYRKLLDQDLAVVERIVVESGAAKDTELLTDSLRNKALDAGQNSTLYNKKAESNKELMSVYSEKNKQYLWDDKNDPDDDDSSAEDAQVRGDIERDDEYVQNKSTYDQLMLDYVSYRTDSENLRIDKGLYEEALKNFTGKKADEQTIADIEKRLDAICEEYNLLYAQTETVIEDYNSFKSSRSIETESNVTAQNTQNNVFIYGLGVVVALGIGVIFSTVYELAYVKRIRCKTTEKEPDNKDISG